MSRQISKDAAAAFTQGKPFSRSNTHVNVQGTRATLSLHENRIAYRPNSVALVGATEITLAGWNTITTRDRLNAILHEVSPLHLYVVQRANGAYIECRDDSIPKEKRLMDYPIGPTGVHDWVAISDVESHFNALMNQ